MNLRKQQVSGFYRDIELGTPYYEETDLKKKNDLWKELQQQVIKRIIQSIL